jgi:adenylylsulfate kinase
MKSSNTVWHHATVSRARREQLHGHRGAVIWFTGLSGSGKSTLSHAVEERLYQAGCHTFVLDGDNIRQGLCADLSFSNIARAENIRRVGEVAKLFVEAGTIVLTAFISPFASDRERVRALLSPDDFIEIYCRCSLEICEERDTKGLYKRARAGEIEEFTGISSPYDVPVNPAITIDTESLNLEECVELVLNLMHDSNIIGPNKIVVKSA